LKKRIDQAGKEGGMIMAVVTALLIGFAGLIVLFAPFCLSADISEQERKYDVSSKEGQEGQRAGDSLNFAV
jgi:hypothetical protein